MKGGGEGWAVVVTDNKSGRQEGSKGTFEMAGLAGPGLEGTRVRAGWPVVDLN